MPEITKIIKITIRATKSLCDEDCPHRYTEVEYHHDDGYCDTKCCHLYKTELPFDIENSQITRCEECIEDFGVDSD